MTVYNLYIFDRNCTCLYYKEWVRHKEAGIPKDEEYKLMYGMIFSIKSLISRLSITSAKEGLVGYSASNYKLHYFETPTGFKFVMNTDTSVGNVQDILRHIYARIFVEYVIRNPLVLPGEPVESELFAANLDEYVQNLSFKVQMKRVRRVARLCELSAFQSGMGPGCGNRVRVAVDCSLDHHMTHDRQLKSLARQIELVYRRNVQAASPFQLHLTGLDTRGRVHSALNTHIRDYNNLQMEVTEERHDRVFNPRDIVYLTPDSSNDLEAVDGSKVLVIGGLVDLCPNKGLTEYRARLAGLSTARLPITRYMEFSSSLPHHVNLPINIVFDMLLDVYRGKDWPCVLSTHMPTRKGFRLRSNHNQ